MSFHYILCSSKNRLKLSEEYSGKKHHRVLKGSEVRRQKLYNDTYSKLIIEGHHSNPSSTTLAKSKLKFRFETMFIVLMSPQLYPDNWILQVVTGYTCICPVLKQQQDEMRDGKLPFLLPPSYKDL